jgi:hypothetical protein
MFWDQLESFSPMNMAMNMKIAKIASATKNSTFATAALSAAIPVKPNIPAMIEITANMIAHLIMMASLSVDGFEKHRIVHRKRLSLAGRRKSVGGN